MYMLSVLFFSLLNAKKIYNPYSDTQNGDKSECIKYV